MVKIKEITKDMTLGEVLALDENLAEVLMGFGMHCFGCPMSRMETLEEASAVHELDLELLLLELNKQYKLLCGTR